MVVMLGGLPFAFGGVYYLLVYAYINELLSCGNNNIRVSDVLR